MDLAHGKKVSKVIREDSTLVKLPDARRGPGINGLLAYLTTNELGDVFIEVYSVQVVVFEDLDLRGVNTLPELISTILEFVEHGVTLEAILHISQIDTTEHIMLHDTQHGVGKLLSLLLSVLKGGIAEECHAKTLHVVGVVSLDEVTSIRNFSQVDDGSVVECWMTGFVSPSTKVSLEDFSKELKLEGVVGVSPHVVEVDVGDDLVAKESVFDH